MPPEFPDNHNGPSPAAAPANHGEPLGLPRGSVRALMGLMIMATALYIVAVTGDIPQVLIGIVGVVVGWYFGSRGANGVK